MVIGRGRHREHPMDTSKGDHVTFGHYECCTTSGCVHPRELRKGQVTFGSHVTTTKKKARGKSRACAEPTSGQEHFRTGPLPVTWLCHFRSKGPTRAEMSTSGCACAEHTSGQGTWLTSLPVSWLTSLLVMRNGPIPRKYDLSCAQILLSCIWFMLVVVIINQNVFIVTNVFFTVTKFIFRHELKNVLCILHL